MKYILPIFSAFILAIFLLTSQAFAIGKPQNPGAAGQLKACQAKENSIKTRSIQLTQLATTMETKFDAIATRVETYYDSKVVPSGKTVANSAALVSDIQIQKTAVQTALTNAQTDVIDFSCTSGKPKDQMTKFREDMQAVKTALKTYRTSIKNLIVAVHSVTGTENSESPKPTK